MVAEGEPPGETPEAVVVRWGVSKATYYNVRARVGEPPRLDPPAE